MSICAALAAKTRAKKAERIAQNLAQAARENAQLGLPAPWRLNGIWLVPLESGRVKPSRAGTVAAAQQVRGEHMTKRNNGPQQIGDLVGGLIVKAQAKAEDKTRKPRAGAKITPAGIILTEQDQKLIEAGAEIATNPPSGEDMAFTHAVLCQVGLPRSKVDGREFMRQSGAAWVNVQAGYLDEGRGPVLQPIPYGVMPRLALAWVSSYAKRDNTREIPIGDSAAEFLRLMGMDDQGGALHHLAPSNARPGRLPTATWIQGAHLQRPTRRTVRCLAGEWRHAAEIALARHDGSIRGLFQLADG